MNPNSPTISATVESFLSAAQADQILTGESVAKYRADIHTFAVTMGDLPVTEITADTFRELKLRLQSRNVGPSFINGIIHAMKRLVRYCSESLAESVHDLAEVRPLKVPRRAVTYLTRDELERFIASIRVQTRAGEARLSGFGFRALIETLAGTGIRLSEALSLNIPDVDWKNQQAKIIGKGGKQRTIFFSERALKWLRRYVDMRHDRSPALFITARSHHRLRRHEAQRLCRVAAARCSLSKRITLHVLRHTFATTLLRNGCPIGHIQGLLGHERLETTCRYYLGLINDDDLKRAHERFLDW